MDIANIGFWIKEKRKEKKMTQADVAEALYVTPQAVSKWERGECFPDISLLPVISELFSSEIKEILNIEEDKNKDISEIISIINNVFDEGFFSQILEKIEDSVSVTEINDILSIFMVFSGEQKEILLKVLLDTSDYHSIINDIIIFLNNDQKEMLAKIIIEKRDFEVLEEIFPYLNKQAKITVLMGMLKDKEYKYLENLIPFLQKEQRATLITFAREENLLEKLYSVIYPFLDKEQRKSMDEYI